MRSLARSGVLFLSALALARAAAKPEELSTMAYFSSFFGAPKGESSEDVQQSMKIIGAGLGRTGTSSLKEALSRLGLKTYHMKARQDSAEDVCRLKSPMGWFFIPAYCFALP